MQPGNSCEHASILAQQPDALGRNDEQAGAMIVRVLAPEDDALLDELEQFAAYRGARADVQQKKPLQRQWLTVLFRISDLDGDIEVDDGLEEGKLLPFIFPDF